MFDALGTQWRIVAGMGGVYYEGIEYTSVKTVCWAQGIKKHQRARVFEDLRIMESAARQVLNNHE